jgi:hypothetical protein
MGELFAIFFLFSSPSFSYELLTWTAIHYQGSSVFLQAGVGGEMGVWWHPHHCDNGA